MKTPEEWFRNSSADQNCTVCEHEAEESPSSRALRLRLADRVREIVLKGALDLHPIEGLHLSYIEESVQAKNCFYRLSVGVILRGHKRLMIGSTKYRY
ncbi:MAG: AraC family transcriptional regulator N-terminal domain-containing protein, partial [Sutterella wadsworthensis]|nr:AraC family transcriptional regulator N-terminal domain-containing protein [Sutterella wadsworthensis]